MANSEQWLVGIHAVDTALRHDIDRVTRLKVSAQGGNKRLAEIERLARDHQIPVERVGADELIRLAGRSAHQGVAALYHAPVLADIEAVVQAVAQAGDDALVLFLDGVQDPGNLGACLRSAECFGVTAAVIPKHRAVGLTPTVHKASAGATSRLLIAQVTNLVDAIKRLKSEGLWIVGAAGESEQSLDTVDLAGPLGVVMGGEEKGLRRLVTKQCDFMASIPMRGDIGSLNVSVATGILLFETDRQRRLRYR